jgi:hypothetical protein
MTRVVLVLLVVAVAILALRDRERERRLVRLEAAQQAMRAPLDARRAPDVRFVGYAAPDVPMCERFRNARVQPRFCGDVRSLTRPR